MMLPLHVWAPMFRSVERCFPYIFLQCSLIFRQAFSGAVTRQGDVFSQLAKLWCLTYLHIMISAARFSDGLGMQYRSRYEAWCGQLAALVFTLLQHFYMDIGILTKRDGNINWAGMARRTTTPAADGRSRFTCSIASVFFYFISRWHSSSCGDGWLVLLELGFKDHSPSVAA